MESERTVANKGPFIPLAAKRSVAIYGNAAWPTGAKKPECRFPRLPNPRAAFNLESGKLVTDECLDVGKSASGKFVPPVEISVAPKSKG